DPTIPRDLETVILTCLRKEPDRRYQSAGQLRADLQRWLAGEAVEARHDSAWYVVSRLARKHKLAASLAAAAWLAGVFSGAGMAVRYQQAAALAQEERDANRARQAEVEAQRAENEALRQKIAELEVRVLRPKSWMSAIESGNQLAEMEPDQGWNFMHETWP